MDGTCGLELEVTGIISVHSPMARTNDTVPTCLSVWLGNRGTPGIFGEHWLLCHGSSPCGNVGTLSISTLLWGGVHCLTPRVMRGINKRQTQEHLFSGE